MIIVAIDELTFERASEIIDSLDSKKCMVKIGSVAFNSIGHEIIRFAAGKGLTYFSILSFTTYQILLKNLFKD